MRFASVAWLGPNVSKPIIKTATAYDTKRDAIITPIPGAVWKDRKWKVKGVDVGGKTNAASAYMEADSHDSPRGAYTRAHEMLHSVFSPEKVPTENGEAYVILEEAQIHAHMKRHLDLPKECYESHEADKQMIFENALPKVETMDRRERALLGVALGDELSDKDRERIGKLLNEADAQALIALIQQTLHLTNYNHSSYTGGRGGYSKQEDIGQQSVAAKFDLLFSEEKPDEEEDEDEGEGEGSSAGGEAEDEGEDDDEGEEKPEGADPAEAPKVEPKHHEKPKTDFERHAEKAQWHEMRIEKPPLIHASKALRLLQKRRATDTGSHITRLTRIVSDGFIFGEKKRVQGGTVLVDTSGSMSLTSEDMRVLLDAAPAATVACYGQNGTPYGVLRIIVDKGRMAADEELAVGGGNGVDGPALEWLAKMPEPRYWVSDGYVIGSNGSGTDHINYCRIVAKRGRIVRLNDIPEAIARLTGKKMVVVK